MIETHPPCSPELPESVQDACAEAVVTLHLVAMRRQFDAIRKVFGDEPPHRAREALWVALEVTLAHRQGCQIALRDLVARANGLLSAPTLSRVVSELERDGFLTCEAATEDSRVKLLSPTPRTLEIVMARADAAFAEFADVVNQAERRLAEADRADPGSPPATPKA